MFPRVGLTEVNPVEGLPFTDQVFGHSGLLSKIFFHITENCPLTKKSGLYYLRFVSHFWHKHGEKARLKWWQELIYYPKDPAPKRTFPALGIGPNICNTPDSIDDMVNYIIDKKILPRFCNTREKNFTF